MDDIKPTGLTMFACENISPSQSPTSNIPVISGSYTDLHSIPPSTGVFPSSGSFPLSNILRNTTLLRNRNFHLSPDNPFLQVDSRPPPGTVFTTEDLCTGLQVDSGPPTGTVFTSEDLCTGRKRRRGKNKDMENSPPQSIRKNQAAIDPTVNKKNLEPQCKGSYQTPSNEKNSVITGSYTDSHPIPSSTGVFPSSGSIPLSNILKNTTLLRCRNFHLSSDNPFLKVASRPPAGTVFTSEDLSTGRGMNKDKENSPSPSIRHSQATINGSSLAQEPCQLRFNGLTSMHSNQLSTRIPLSNISNIDTSRRFLQKKGEVKKNKFLGTLFEETEVSHGEDKDNDNLAGMGIRVAVKPKYCITPPILAEAEKESPNWNKLVHGNLPSEPEKTPSQGSTTDPTVHKYIVSTVPLAVTNFRDDSAKAEEFANGYTLSSEMGFPSNSVAEALFMFDYDTDEAVANSSTVHHPV